MTEKLKSTTSDPWLEAAKKHEECMCRKQHSLAFDGMTGIVEKIYRARVKGGGPIKAKVLWDDGKVRYHFLDELTVF